MKPKRRIISFLLAICLVAGLMPTAAFAAGTDTGKAIQLVDSGTAANISGKQADNIYFGTWGGNPIKWRVLDDKTNTGGSGLFLLSDALLGTGLYGDVYFDDSGDDSNAWQNSTAQEWCGTFYNGNFSKVEQGAVLETTKSDGPFTGSAPYSVPFGASKNILNRDRVFFLSAEEAENSTYGFTDDNARIANYGKRNRAWWLRSPHADFIGYAGVVTANGRVNFSDVHHEKYAWAARPAFNLDLNSVLFTSAAEGGKAADAISEIGDYAGNEWKLTLLDRSRDFGVTEETVNGNPGNTITLNYTGATTGENNEYISVIIADGSDAQYYGRVAQPHDASGQIEIKIPASLADGTYTLNVFSEQYNGGENDDTKLTDYASAFEAVTLNVSSDTTAPTLTGGSATRTSDTAATVKFTSNEAGSYYYTVVESGADEPDVNSSGTGTACDTTEQTISLTTLTAGAKDIYIVVKDAAGNISGKLKIEIPAYVAPSYGISADPSTLDFGSATEGYSSAPAAQTVIITNTGNQTITLNQPTATDFNIGTLSTTDLAAGGTATFTVQPKTGLAAGSHNETLTISGSNDTSASVTLAFQVDPKQYLVTVNDSYAQTTGAGSYAKDATVTIDAGTRSGYTFDGWTSADGVEFANVDSEKTTFTMPDKAVTVTANWTKKSSGGGGPSYDYDTITITITAGEGGSISPSSSVSVRSGKDQTFTITPDKGYAISDVKIDGKSVGAVKSYTFENVKKNHTIEVVFVKVSGNPQTGVFVDVPEGSYYEEAVNWAVEKGITTGIDATHFSPDGICTRAQTVTFLWRAAGSPAAKSAVMPFTDVKAGSYYYDAVLWAVEQGITKGTSDTMFSPDATCSRAQIVTFLWCSQKSPAAGTANPFTDVKASAYYADAVLWAVKEDVTKGTTDTTFSSNADCTRAQIVTFIWRALAE